MIRRKNIKKPVKIFEEPDIKKPIMLAAWPGMGYVAMGVVGYLSEKLHAQQFAEIEPGDYFPLSTAYFKDRIIDFPQLPKSQFFSWKDPDNKNDLLIFLGDTQPVPHKAKEFAGLVLDVAEKYNVRMIHTSAAMPVHITHKDTPRVWAVPNDEPTAKLLKSRKAPMLTQGEIGGMNGVLLSVAKLRNMSGICLLGEIPYYTVEMVNPKASHAILKIILKEIGVTLDLKDIELSAKYVENELDKRIKEEAQRMVIYAQPQEEEHQEPGETEEPRIPPGAREEIERLFDEATKDRSKATELKGKLDQWGLFSEYEDRFLGLFRKGNQ